MELTDDFIRYGPTGGAYAGNPSKIASLFKEGNLKQQIDKPLILNYFNGREKKWPKALDYIKYYIDLFRQWAYRRADGDKQLLQEIDNYINSLYEWLKQGNEKGQFDDIELTRLKAQKQSLTDKLYDYIPERLISGGQDSIDRLMNDIENSEHVTKYPPNPSETWYNGEIERLSLLSEKITLLMRLVRKIHPENANKYDYLNCLDNITGDIAYYVGVLELNRDKLYESVGKTRIDIVKHFSEIDASIEDSSRDIKRHFSELKERLTVSTVNTDKVSGRDAKTKAGKNVEAILETTKLEGNPMCDQVFICYSHKDKRWLDDMQTHLKPYVRNGSLMAWSDKQIAPGSKWFPDIKAALASTKVAVLLVTPNFIASDFIYEHELTPLLKEAEKGNVRIIWVSVRTCAYKETPLKEYQAANDPDKPLANMKAERDKTWVKICEEIKKAVSSS